MIVTLFKKIPAAIVIVPLFVGMLIHLIMETSMSEMAFANYNDIIVNISNVLLMLLVFGICSQLNFKKVGSSLKRGAVLLSLKFFVAAVLAILVVVFAGPAGFLGISALAIVAAISNPNTALFAGIAKQYGEDEDAPAIMILSLGNGPFFSLLILSASGLLSVDFLTMLIPLLPMILGIMVGNLIPRAQPYLLKMTIIILPIFALILGTTISVITALRGGAQGLLLGFVTLVLTGILAYFISGVYMGKGKRSPMAAGAGTTAGNAIMVPAFIAGLSGTSDEIIAASNQAVAQVAGSMIFTAIFAPLVVSMVFKYEQRRREKLGIERIVTFEENNRTK